MNLTKHAIEALPKPDSAKPTLYRDSRVPGLGVAVHPTGNKQFFWYRKVRGRRVWRTIGDFPELTIENAREKAGDYNKVAARWKADGYEGPSPFERASAEPTLGEALEDYVAKHIRSGHGRVKRPESAEKRVRQAAKYLAPLLKRKLGSITKADARSLHAEVAQRPLKRAGDGRRSADRAVELLRAVFYWAIETEIFHGENPARNPKRRGMHFGGQARDRFLLPEEAPRFFAALRDEPSADLRDFVVLSLFTGARMSDVLSMRWPDLSMEGRSWRVPDPKNKVPYVVPLLPEAIETLKARHARDGSSEWVFPSELGKSGHLVTIKKSWKGLLRRAGIANLWRHDLRRTLGSWMAKSGASLPLIGKSLGHADLSATQIYSRLDLAPVREAMRGATKRLLAAGKKKRTSK